MFKELFDFVLQREQTVVFGNLGRYPQILFNALLTIPQLEVAVVSKHYRFPSTSDNRIRSIRSEEVLRERCDLLIFIEPAPLQRIEKPSNVSRMVVFTSHLNFEKRPETLFSNVCYYHATDLNENARRTRALLEIQDGSLQTRDSKHVRLDHVNNIVIRGKNDSLVEVDVRETYVLIDLTKQTSAFEMFLAFWDAFDFLIGNFDYIKGWLICFPEKNGRRAFEQFTQNCLDKLFCTRFDYGNLQSLSDILSLLPFYRSGTIDKTFKVPIANFGNVSYVAAQTALEACKAAAMYNLQHLAGPVFRVKD